MRYDYSTKKDRYGLNITQYEEDDSFSMSSITLQFHDEGEKALDPYKLHIIRQLFYIFIQKTEYYKDGWLSDYTESSKFHNLSFCLTPHVTASEALELVQLLCLKLLGLDLNHPRIIKALGNETVQKMIPELDATKDVVWEYLRDITQNKKIYEEEG